MKQEANNKKPALVDYYAMKKHKGHRTIPNSGLTLIHQNFAGKKKLNKIKNRENIY
jgi:hypothetical protein